MLLGKNDEAKISDFGLSIGNNDKEDKIKQRMPIRWLAPEVLRKGSFSTKSDVWSFGVLTWEIFNRAKTHPFPGLSIQEAKEKVSVLIEFSNSYSDSERQSTYGGSE